MVMSARHTHRTDSPDFVTYVNDLERTGDLLANALMSVQASHDGHGIDHASLDAALADYTKVRLRGFDLYAGT